jgi:uncharacterized membrane protein YkoI
MTIRHLASAALLAIHLAALPIAAGRSLAQEPAPAAEPAISRGDARRIAIDNGLVRIEAIELEDGVWQIDGRDADDGEVELDIDATDGHVLRLERERPESAEIMR